LAHWGTNCAWPRLGSRLKRSSVEEIFKQPERSTKDVLKSEGFRQEIIHRFFRPFVGGILLDSELKTTSRMFEFVFKMLSEGSTRVPARGMGAIPAQIAEKFSADAVLRLNSRVESLHENEITLAGGESMRARAIVVATDGPSAAHLIGEAESASRSVSAFITLRKSLPFRERCVRGTEMALDR
jgi:phytoene dehydrogenase-like protein